MAERPYTVLSCAMSIDGYIAGEVAKRIYLQPGNTVLYTSNRLGSILTTVVPAAAAK